MSKTAGELLDREARIQKAGWVSIHEKFPREGQPVFVAFKTKDNEKFTIRGTHFKTPKDDPRCVGGGPEIGFFGVLEFDFAGERVKRILYWMPAPDFPE